MLNQFLFFVALPLAVAAIIFSILWYYLSSHKYKGLPHALAEGFSGSKYRLTRGVERGTTDFYYDIDLSVTNPVMLQSVVDWYLAAINKIGREYGPINRIAFIEKDSGPVGAIVLTGILVERTKIPAIIVRLRRRLMVNSLKGGEIKAGDRVILVSDVLTSGGGIKNAIQKLRLHKVKVRAAIVLVNRMNSKDIKELEKELAIPLFYAYGITNKGELEQHPIKKFIDVLKEDKEEKRDPRVPSRNSISA
jgi:orotate phosphoribosyltransferase